MAERDPIDTYTEGLFQVRRDFFLYPDRVVIRAKWRLKGTRENTVQLANLKPEPRTLYIRQKARHWAGWLFTIGLLVLAITLYNNQGQATTPILAYVGGIVAAAGFSLLLMTYPKIRFVRFETEEGRAGLDIGQAGPDKRRFDDFIDQVRKQIRKARRA